MNLSELKHCIREVLMEEAGFGDVKLADKWVGGEIVFMPRDPSMQEKRMPINAFFHKVVLVREKLRVLEQRINTSALSDAEKVQLQQYITKVYGSLTSFNILFKEQRDKFVGDKG
ncbi:MAG: hypothetical protein QME81_00240 [bacterium]|nr:hypothetical protein [bacterium]